MYTIDIDTGGTFTDAFACGDGHTERLKVDTTPHDLTVCFMNCIEEAAKRAGFEDPRGLLRQTEVIRFSTTIGTNTLIQRSGPKLGLIVSKGCEDSVYEDSGIENPVLDFIVPRDLVSGISGQIDSSAKEW